MFDLTELKSFIQEPHCYLGENAWILADLIKEMKNSRFIDLGVRLGPSSAIMSINANMSWLEKNIPNLNDIEFEFTITP